MAVSDTLPTQELLFRQLGEAINEIQIRLAEIQQRYAVPFEGIRTYLEVNEPHLVDSMDMLERECDNDICAKLEEGKISRRDYDDWLRCLRDWKHLLLEGISRFENFQMMAHVA